MQPTNHLFYGDNLDVLRAHVPDASVDLIYLDPPFNSNANYNILFKSPEGRQSESQIEAFEDTWHWNDRAERAFDEVMHSGNTGAFTLLRAMREFLGDNDMMAYLAMMAVRLIELHRVLKPTGSLYLHCDPTASHYLKLLLDGVFGAKAYRNEIIWDYSFRLMDLPSFYNRKHDVILFYAKGKGQTFHMPKTAWTRDDLERSRKQKIHTDDDGVEWIWMPGGKGKSKSKMRRVDDIIEGGKAISDVWRIPIISSSSRERLGYPTQKPLALLERIISASSSEGDVVLDPFCGCGTAVHAAQKLGRRWIGIDVTHLAIGLIEKRMTEAFPGIAFEVVGRPQSLSSARDLARRDKHQFELWALSVVEADPWKGGRKGPDGGIDGIIWFKPDGKKTEKAIVEVKGGGTGVKDVGRLAQVIQRENAKIGVLITAQMPTRAMERDAAAVGVWANDYTGRKHGRLQIITLAELFQNKRPDIPWVDTTVGKKARREETATQGSLL
ncbi:site-specific DNA-methyltransferase (adenine-specific) [Hephaestia caeni]|uniref:Methyltransferase n=1 Tax=Hephaestia caeni TaxID=645617 RepID=A0A397NSN8_9SPHN|nr:DNA methyltransferase [Hephaestia caeni]RIA37735.1 site-specific DNA-methyltransferase (adenine-specific) [Hephaestia caeni]